MSASSCAMSTPSRATVTSPILLLMIHGGGARHSSTHHMQPLSGPGNLRAEARSDLSRVCGLGLVGGPRSLLVQEISGILIVCLSFKD